MRLVFSGKFTYVEGAHLSFTGLQVFDLGNDKSLAITNELSENQGISVPNDVARVAGLIIEKFDLNPELFELIDHSPEGIFFSKDDFHKAPIAWDGKKFCLTSTDRWDKLSRKDVETLIQQPYQVAK
jgi:hypothetical protein